MRLQIHEKHPLKVKNFGIWIRYDSRSGTHNMYKEYREMSRCEAVEAMYQDLAARHRARFRSIHVRCLQPITNGRNCQAGGPRGTERLTKHPDSPCRRAREGRRCQAPLHQAAPDQEPLIPSASPYPQDQQEEGLLRHSPFDFRLNLCDFCSGVVVVVDAGELGWELWMTTASALETGQKRERWSK